MEENISKALSFIAEIILLIAAFSLFFILYRDSFDTLAMVNRAISDKGAVYQADSQETKEAAVTGADIIGVIKDGLETDIMIDSNPISASADVSSFHYGIIDIKAWYSVEYLFHPSGEVSVIQYRKK